MKDLKKYCAVLPALLFVTFSAIAEVDLPQEAKGLTSSSYSLSDYESANLANGNLNFHIALTSLHTDGGLEYSVVAYFNSKAWRVGWNCGMMNGGGYDDCTIEDTGLISDYFLSSGIENYGFGWDLRPPRLKPAKDQPVTEPDQPWRYIDASGATHILQDRPWWDDPSGATIQPAYTGDVVDEHWYTGDGTNYRFTVKAVDSQSRAINVRMESPNGTVFIFSHISPTTCDEPGTQNFLKDTSGLYLTSIERGPWSAQGVAANTINFVYETAVSTWDVQCATGQNPPWLLKQITASGNPVRKVIFNYVSMELGPVGDVRTVSILDSISIPKFDPSLTAATSNTDAAIDWAVSAQAYASPDSSITDLESTHLDSITFPGWTTASFAFDESGAGVSAPLQEVRLPSGATVEYEYAITWPVSAFWYQLNSQSGPEIWDFMWVCGFDIDVSVSMEDHSWPATPYDYGQNNTYGLRRRIKRYYNSSGSEQVETTAFAQALSCRGKTNFDNIGQSAIWPYDFRYGLKDKHGTRHDYLWTIVAEYEGEDITASPPLTAEIHRFHPLSRQEFSADLVVGAGIKNQLSYALGTLAHDTAPYLYGEKLSERDDLRVIRHTEMERGVLTGGVDDKFNWQIDRYDYLARSSVFTDESADSTVVDLKADPNPCYPDVTIPGGATVTTCTEVKTTRTVDDYLNEVTGTVFFDDPVSSTSKYHKVKTDYLYQVGNPAVNLEAKWVLGLPAQRLITEDEVPARDTTGEARKTAWSWRDMSDDADHASYVVDEKIEHPDGTLQAPTCTSEDCIVHTFHFDSLGNQVNETLSGGNGDSFGTLELTTHTDYLFGVPAWQGLGSLSCTDPVDPDNCTFSMKLGLWQRFIDPGTGLPRLEIDGAGVGRAFLWDGSRRLTDIIPIRGSNEDRSSPWGRIAWAFNLETTPETNEVMKGLHVKYEEPDGSTLLTRSLYDASWTSSTVSSQFMPGSYESDEPRAVYQFDGMGNLSLEKEYLPANGIKARYRSKYHLSFLPGTSAPCSPLATIPSGVARLGLSSEWVEGETVPQCPTEGSWAQWTLDEYDSLGRSLLTRLPDGTESTRAYIGDSVVVSSRSIVDGIDTGGNAITNSYSTTATTDGLGRLRILEEQMDQTTSFRTEYDFDQMKHLIEVRLFSGDASSAAQKRSYTYSAAGFLRRSVEPEGEIRYPGWDAARNLREKRFFKDGSPFNTAEYSYDVVGRLTGISDTAGGERMVQSWGDDLDLANVGNSDYNRLTQTTRHNSFDGGNDVQVSREWRYTGPGARVSERDTSISDLGAPGDHFTIAYGYDVWGNRSRLDFPTFVGCRSSDWDGIRWEYDGPWMKSIGITGDGSQLSLGEMEYHPSGRLHRLTYYGGLATWEETADPSGMARPADISLSIGGVQVPLAGFGQMEYDGAGNIWKIGDVLRYSYDGLSRLKEFRVSDGASGSFAQYTGYTYDRWGNLVQIRRPSPSKTGEDVLNFDLVDGNSDGVPDDNRIDTVGNAQSKTAVSLTWDDLGNLSHQTALSPLLPEKYFDWSLDDRLMSSMDVAGATTWKYAYDAAGERVARWMKNGSGETTADFYIRDEGGQLISEWWYTPGGSRFDVRRDYVRIGTKLLAEIDHEYRPDGLLFHAEDHLGSSRITFSEYGEVEDNIGYLPFGKLDLAPDEGEIDTTHLFTGHERDLGTGSSGLDYMHQRYYSPVLGRFISVDPVAGKVGLSQSQNRYTYALNNPLGVIDPDGRGNFGVLSQQAILGPMTAKQRTSFLKSQKTAEPVAAAGWAAAFVADAAAVEATPVVWSAILDPSINVPATVAIAGIAGVDAPLVGPIGKVTPSQIRAAAASEDLIQIVTKQTGRTIDVARNLSVAVGEGAEAVANAARSKGILFSGQVPKALVSLLEQTGLIERKTLEMGGKNAVELRIKGPAVGIISDYLGASQ